MKTKQELGNQGYVEGKPGGNIRFWYKPEWLNGKTVKDFYNNVLQSGPDHPNFLQIYAKDQNKKWERNRFYPLSKLGIHPRKKSFTQIEGPALGFGLVGKRNLNKFKNIQKKSSIDSSNTKFSKLSIDDVMSDIVPGNWRGIANINDIWVDKAQIGKLNSIGVYQIVAVCPGMKPDVSGSIIMTNNEIASYIGHSAKSIARRGDRFDNVYENGEREDFYHAGAAKFREMGIHSGDIYIRPLYFKSICPETINQLKHLEGSVICHINEVRPGFLVNSGDKLLDYEKSNKLTNLSILSFSETMRKQYDESIEKVA